LAVIGAVFFTQDAFSTYQSNNTHVAVYWPLDSHPSLASTPSEEMEDVILLEQSFFCLHAIFGNG